MEKLALLTHFEGSGSTRVAFEAGQIAEAAAACLRIRRQAPSGFGTCDMAYYCFICAVPKGWEVHHEVVDD